MAHRIQSSCLRWIPENLYRELLLAIQEGKRKREKRKRIICQSEWKSSALKTDHSITYILGEHPEVSQFEF